MALHVTLLLSLSSTEAEKGQCLHSIRIASEGCFYERLKSLTILPLLLLHPSLPAKGYTIPNHALKIVIQVVMGRWRSQHKQPNLHIV